MEDGSGKMEEENTASVFKVVFSQNFREPVNLILLFGKNFMHGSPVNQRCKWWNCGRSL